MPANPSRFLIREFDLKTPLREWCTCPHCLVVWTHKETMHHDKDWEWARAHYSDPYICPECGTMSVPIRKQERKTLPRRIRNEDRRIISGPLIDNAPSEAPPAVTPQEPPRTSRGSRLAREERDR